MGFFSRAADDGDFLKTFERQQAVIFQQNNPFVGNLMGKLMVRVDVKAAAFRRFSGFEDDPQDAAHRFI